MMKCPKCDKNLVNNDKNAKAKGNWQYWVGTGAILFTGPVGTAAGALVIGAKLFNKHILNEVEVKCPHCGATITLTKQQYKQLKREIDEAETKARHAKQNRIKE